MSLTLAASQTFSSATWISYKKIKPPVVQSPAFQKWRKQCFSVKAIFFNPAEDPVVKEALNEPVAFMGGMFAGLLRLDLNEDPLREWVTRTVEASGLGKEDSRETDEPTPDDEAPLQIEIE